MSTGTATGETSITGRDTNVATPRWQTALLWSSILVLFVVAIGMRLYNLGAPFDRDSYDEGVYWQSLRAMSAGYTLYQHIFYSQPPMFLLSTYPFYSLFGVTLWSARLGIALVSLIGLIGAVLLGKALKGWLGAALALLLLVVDPLYLAQSQTIQAEVSSVAFSLLAVGLAYLWWENSTGRRGLLLAGLSGVAISLSILSKLFGLACIVPIASLLLARLWLAWRDPETRLSLLRAALVGIATCLLTLIVVFLPFLGSWHEVIHMVISFHTAAATYFAHSGQSHLQIMRPELTSMLAIAALYGTIVALVRRDWRVIPLLLWLLVTLYLLYQQTPLFAHHLVILVPPLIALAVMGVGPLPSLQGRTDFSAILSRSALILAIPLILMAALLAVQSDMAYYQLTATRSSDSQYQQASQVASDLRNAITSDQLVITDAQFIAALANRNVPPDLVDTSMVRIGTGYLTQQQLITQASQPQVHAILFYTGRLYTPSGAFYLWVTQHFHLVHTYGSGKELWVR